MVTYNFVNDNILIINVADYKILWNFFNSHYSSNNVAKYSNYYLSCFIYPNYLRGLFDLRIGHNEIAYYALWNTSYDFYLIKSKDKNYIKHLMQDTLKVLENTVKLDSQECCIIAISCDEKQDGFFNYLFETTKLFFIKWTK